MGLARKLPCRVGRLICLNQEAEKGSQHSDANQYGSRNPKMILTKWSCRISQPTTDPHSDDGRRKGCKREPTVGRRDSMGRQHLRKLAHF